MILLPKHTERSYETPPRMFAATISEDSDEEFVIR